jgi:hypothetical protein
MLVRKGKKKKRIKSNIAILTVMLRAEKIL